MSILIANYISAISTPTTRIMCEAAIDGYVALFEDAAGKASHKTRKKIREIMTGYDLDATATDGEGNPLLTQSRKKQTYLEYMERQVRDVFFHGSHSDIRFEPGVARIAFGELSFLADQSRADDIQKLKRIVEIISSAHESEYDDNLNGMSYEDISERFSTAVRSISDSEFNEINNGKYETSGDYRIVEIHSFGEAKKYYEYTNPDSRWCLTHMEDMWDSYTERGRNRVYFCLKNGFENMQPEVGENCPLDEYGLSMFCVIVTNDNEVPERPMLVTSTCRWNHDNGGSDSILSVKQISQVIGQSFYNAFPPFSPDALHARGIYTFKEKLDQYAETKDTSIFDAVDSIASSGWRRVILGNKTNYIREDEPHDFLLSRWVDSASPFNRGNAIITMQEKSTVIDAEGNIVFKKWYDDVSSTRSENGYWIVTQDEDKVNFVKPDGTELSDMWFASVSPFHGKYTRVANGRWKYNLIDEDGKLVFDTWLYSVGNVDSETGNVIIGTDANTYNVYNVNSGNTISQEWFAEVRPITSSTRMYLVYKDSASTEKSHARLCNLMDSDGNIVSKTWFAKITEPFHGLSIVYDTSNRQNILSEGNLWSPGMWFDCIEKLDSHGAIVRTNGKINLLRPDGHLVFEQWLDNGQIYYIGADMYRISKPRETAYIDKLTGFTSYSHENILMPDDTYISDEWFDDINGTFNTAKTQHITLMKNGRFYRLDRFGKIE